MAPDEPNLLDALDEGRARRDVGARAAENAAHTIWRVAAECAIDELAADGRDFDADDLHDRVGGPPGHRNAVGSLFLTAARDGKIRHVGYRQSRRPDAHARVIRVWRGAA